MTHGSLLHGALLPAFLVFTMPRLPHSALPLQWELCPQNFQSIWGIGPYAGCTLRAVLLPAVLVFTVLSNLGQSWALLGFIALLYGPLLWLTVLLHELGHCLATRKVCI